MTDRNLPEEKIQCHITLTETQQKKLDWLCSPPPAFFKRREFNLTSEQFSKESVLTAILMDFLVFRNPDRVELLPLATAGESQLIQFKSLAKIHYCTFDILRRGLSSDEVFFASSDYARFNRASDIFIHRDSDDYSKIMAFQLEYAQCDHVSVGFMLQFMHNKSPFRSMSEVLVAYYEARLKASKSEDSDLEGVAE